jgi:hypothetical protein
MQHKVTAQIGSTQISIETGKIAKLADGAVIVSCGDTEKRRPRSENFRADISNAKGGPRKRKRSLRA